jgi:hypothetical protein
MMSLGILTRLQQGHFVMNRLTPPLVVLYTFQSARQLEIDPNPKIFSNTIYTIEVFATIRQTDRQTDTKGLYYKASYVCSY